MTFIALWFPNRNNTRNIWLRLEDQQLASTMNPITDAWIWLEHHIMERSMNDLHKLTRRIKEKLR